MSEGTTFGEATVDGAPVEKADTAYTDFMSDPKTFAETDEALAEVVEGAGVHFVADEVVEVKDPETLAEEAAELTLEQQKALINEYFPLPDDFPAEEQIKEWEVTYGRLRIHRIAPHEAYVIRALNRAEFRQYLTILKKKFAGAVDPDAAEERMVQEELLVERCTLYPTVTAADIRGESKPLNKIGLAGTVSILAFDVQEISNLIDNAVGPFEEV